MSLLSLFRGTTSEVDARTRKDGQLLVDTEAGAVKVDVAQSGIINRITVSGSGGTSSQSDFAETDSTKASYIKHKPTNTSDFTDTLFIYGDAEPTTDLVDNKTEWIGGDGRVNLTLIGMDGNTYAVLRRTPGETFPDIDDPKIDGYQFDHWSPSFPNTIPSVDTTYTAVNVSEVTLTFKDYDGTILEMLEDVTPGDPMPTITDPTRSGYRFNGWSPSLGATIPYCNTIYEADYSKQVTLTFMGYEVPQTNYDYHETYDTVVTYEGDPFPTPTETPEASSDSPAYSVLQPVFVKWKDTFPEVVPGEDTVYKSEWKTLKTIRFSAVIGKTQSGPTGVTLRPYNPDNLIQYSGYSGVELEPFTPPETVTKNDVTYHYNNRWLSQEDFSQAYGEPTWIVPSLEDLYEICPNSVVRDITYYADYIPSES